MDINSIRSEVYNIDCMILMKRYPDKYFDLAVVDPPYGINIENSGRLVSEKGLSKKGWDSSAPELEYFEELFRVSKNQIVWGANHFISKMPYNSSCWLIWDKKQPEDISFASCELAWTSFTSVTKTFYWHPQKQNENRIHPTQKPICLYEWILIKYAEKGMKILDTHLGSGSSRIAAHKAGMSFIGCELDKEYFDAQEIRFKNFISQLTLF